MAKTQKQPEDNFVSAEELATLMNDFGEGIKDELKTEIQKSMTTYDQQTEGFKSLLDDISVKVDGMEADNEIKKAPDMLYAALLGGKIDRGEVFWKVFSIVVTGRCSTASNNIARFNPGDEVTIKNMQTEAHMCLHITKIIVECIETNFGEIQHENDKTKA